MISIQCTLHGSLEDSLSSRENTVELAFEQQPSVKQILSRLEIKQDYLHFALVGGHYLDFEQWDKPISGHQIQLWPRIAGG